MAIRTHWLSKRLLAVPKPPVFARPFDRDSCIIPKGIWQLVPPSGHLEGIGAFQWPYEVILFIMMFASCLDGPSSIGVPKQDVSEPQL